MGLRYNELNLREFEAHSMVLSLIKPNTKVLDLGCATGYIGDYLQKEKHCQVWGVEQDKDLVAKAKKVLQKVYIADLEDLEKLPIHEKFDYVLLMDVIEHVTFYEDLLRNIKKYLGKNGKVIISTPNIAHLSMRLNLLFGQFNYQEKGILDRTHAHFFTRKSLLLLIKQAGYKVTSIDYSADFGQIPFAGRFLRHVPKNIQHTLTKHFNTLFAGQFIVQIT